MIVSEENVMNMRGEQCLYTQTSSLISVMQALN